MESTQVWRMRAQQWPYSSQCRKSGRKGSVRKRCTRIVAKMTERRRKGKNEVKGGIMYGHEREANPLHSTEVTMVLAESLLPSFLCTHTYTYTQQHTTSCQRHEFSGLPLFSVPRSTCTPCLCVEVEACACQPMCIVRLSHSLPTFALYMLCMFVLHLPPLIHTHAREWHSYWLPTSTTSSVPFSHTSRVCIVLHHLAYTHAYTAAQMKGR
mmetsp:Transcript_23757/g.59954  ORF Transcript_23757/g.59954 Transcript_23757/m.59954 type:complete len:211 (+) Transcript_23757:1021-1653(+)